MNNILNDYKIISYYEEKKLLNKDMYFTAAQICENSFYKDYIMYENNGELSIGMGRFATVIATPDEVTVEVMKKTFTFDNEDINSTLHNAFMSIPIKNWRAYGIANFGLAYYNYQLPLTKEGQILLKMFIPKLELRLENGIISIRALDSEDLAKMNEFVEKLNQDIKKEYELENRIEKSKIMKVNILDDTSEYYKSIVKKAVEEIKNEKYEKVILSRKILIDKELDIFGSYIAGRRINNPARSYILNLQGLQVIGYSPETVAEISKDGMVSTFPLAGTRAVGINEEETNKLKEELLRDPKEIAEHAVSVKLAYEELEKVCELDSVHVNEFMSVLERGTVQHLASRLKGKLKKGYNEWHAFNALFPAVTASGIPKKKAIEAIEILEEEPRDLYSGSVLTYDSDGTIDAALVLRSIYQDDKNTWLRAGAGIVELSLPERELVETCEKLSSVSNQLIFLE
ncbi:salicylate synthase [Clostridium sporogenes]|uniref:Salicylate synthase n=1 Tax=Clostridium botulinum TaxID=1491 RepID=A0A6M0SW29_CLOBO|nr:salicylate synthase [Clostridium sporogenes]NFA59719.1 salicylate synthase [Clostridium botulinum]NFI73150.1 salicylate synthase [Clostridium sporogenes]NFL73204.1 salicylate synthase [Clostridium sporogenes]NFM24639.1 salicylate synthase [Clostridium sporogenes]NFP60562.1 salicylate synthase [Clostridium sporogenes]